MRILLCALFVLFPLMRAHAEAPIWQPRYDESHIRFISTESGKKSEGAFKTFTADIKFSPDALADSRVDVTIDMTSLFRADTDAYEALKGAAFFNITSYKTARFTADDFEKTGENAYIAHGILTIKDISHPLDLPFTLEITDGVAHMQSEMTVLRLDYGIGTGEWADPNFIANEVLVKTDLVADKL